MKLLTELLSVRRLDNEPEKDITRVCKPVDIGYADEEDYGEKYQQYAVYYDYTGAGRGVEPIAGPFYGPNAELEADEWMRDYPRSQRKYVFVDVYPPPGSVEDEEVDPIEAEGEKAYEEGYKRSDNPYRRFTRERKLWLDGYDYAQAKSEMEIEKHAWGDPELLYGDDYEDEEDWESAEDRFERLSNVAADGTKARRRGLGADANPYKLGTEEYEAWRRGWRKLTPPSELLRSPPRRKYRDFENEEKSDAYFDGKEAHYDGKTVKECPYPENSEEYNDWMRGYKDAERESYRAGWDDGWSRGVEDYEAGGLGAYGQMGMHMSGGPPGWEDDEEDQEEERFSLNAEEDPNAELAGTEEPELDVDPEAEIGDTTDQETDVELDLLADKAAEDPDRQGLIRQVKGAHLVYKRQTEDGTYEELWVYNSGGNLRDELDIRKAVLAGTDIPTTKTQSPDGAQQYELWSCGNVEMLQIVGLPN